MSDVSGIGGKLHFDFTPVDETARQKIQTGDFGQFKDVVIEDKTVSVKTDLAVFKFTGPQLPEPMKEIPPSAYSQAGEALGNLSMEKNLTDIMEIMKLFHEVALASRQSAREVRHAEREKMVQAIHDQADKIRDAALKTMIAGIITGTMQIVGGVVSMAGGVKGLKAIKKGGPDATAISQAMSTKWMGASQIIQAIGQGLAIAPQYLAEMDRADQKMLEADQKIHETHAQDETEWMQNMREVIRETRQKLEEVIRAQQETMKHITRV
jgi:hypothetical protein